MNGPVQNLQPEGGKSRRVYLLLLDEISNGTYPEGALLPGEQRLAQMYSVSRVTVRRALDALARDGRIEKRTGAGSVVLPARRDTGVTADLTTLIPQLEEMHRRTTARLLSFSYGPAPGPVAQALGLEPGAEVQMAQRVRLLDGGPFSHLTTHVPADLASRYSESDLATTPLFRLLERGGVTVAGARQWVSATLATPEVARSLDISEGSALISLIRVVRDAEGRAIEHLAALYRPDLYRFEMSLARVGAEDARHWSPVIGAEGGA
ncbi:GntR family transcriptional regulator [Oceanibium sediminis]|uniref:GntR family transcriptional regulator n=1 Tax=Oceanibium sediminis TaxID=2026339 RepID=UPI000DD2C3CB|nr:GntR family transcriptional regulator [Oceanibium sediminis]